MLIGYRKAGVKTTGEIREVEIRSYRAGFLQWHEEIGEERDVICIS